jgi:putative PIN family toxin of toxin-antitoxin system
MKVLIDTNILLAIVPKRSKVRWLYDALREQKITLVVTTEILDEYAEKLEWFYSANFADLVLEELLNLQNIEQTTIFYNWQIIEDDPDDNKFIDAAISSGADYIITHDKHFKLLDLIDFPVVRCVSLNAFERIFIASTDYKG